MKKIEWLERKTTSTGKAKIDASILDEAGTKHEGVTIWDNFPGFETLAPGHEVDADIVVKQNGQYTNKTLYPKRSSTSGGFKGSSGIKAAQERKGEMIKEAQERKEESIAFFNSCNSAITLISTHQLYKDIRSPAELKQTIILYRDWFYKQWLEHELPNEKVEEDENIPF